MPFFPFAAGVAFASLIIFCYEWWAHGKWRNWPGLFDAHQFIFGRRRSSTRARYGDRAPLSYCHFLSVFGQVLFNGSAFLRFKQRPTSNEIETKRWFEAKGAETACNRIASV